MIGHACATFSTAKVRPIEECAYCHIASAKRDDVWTQFYGLLDQVPVPAGVTIKK